MIIRTKHRDGYWVYHDDEATDDCRLEVSEQIDSMAWVKEYYPEERKLTFHVPNESDSKPQHRQSLQQQGVTAGVSDIITLWGPGAAFEMKRERKGKSSVSKDQREFLAGAAKQKHFSALCYGAKAFKAAWADYHNAVKHG